MAASLLRIAADTPMGATLLADGATFRVWAPHALQVHVLGDFSGRASRGEGEIRDSDELANVKAVAVSRDTLEEVMARLKSRGRVRRTLVRAAGTGAPPAVPVALWRGDRKEGELRSAVPDAAGHGYLGLALVSAENPTKGGALAVSPGGSPPVEISLIS